MNLIEYPDREMMMIDLANTLAGELRSAVTGHDFATFAVPGGTTPGPIFDVLCAADLDWARVRVMLTDERLVPPDDARSNQRLLRERLLVERAAAAKYVSIVPAGDVSDLGAGLEDYLPISVLLLGMGADMHTASLFPGADNLAAALAEDAPVLMEMRAPGAPEPRVTLSARVLNDAMSKHVVITGEDKRAALARAQELRDPEKAPIWAVLGDATVHWAA